ncbi:polysaccharide deacetylase family protein [Streptomyces daliensis]|uniref:Polysaccharide deacetylase family protein n=1 Tax=Streptomyces daliensis TaxID=299421 RepID=A0A8T4IYQ8_9ACTN|nr:polysaccharide deacetylase family protein [Streptomyces daliensis]
MWLCPPISTPARSRPRTWCQSSIVSRAPPLSYGPLAHEIGHCRDIIATETGTRPVSFAYPYGYSSRRVREAVRAGGFGQSLAVNNALARRTQGPYALTRYTVRRSTDLAEFQRLVEGRPLGRDFALDKVLGRGYAVVRRGRRALTALAAPDTPAAPAPPPDSPAPASPSNSAPDPSIRPSVRPSHRPTRSQGSPSM